VQERGLRRLRLTPDPQVIEHEILEPYADARLLVRGLEVIDARKVQREAGITEVELGSLDEAFASGCGIGIERGEQKGRFEQREPALRCRPADRSIASEIGLVVQGAQTQRGDLDQAAEIRE